MFQLQSLSEMHSLIENLLFAACPSLFHVPLSVYSSWHLLPSRSRVLFLRELQAKTGVKSPSFNTGVKSQLLQTRPCFSGGQGNVFTITDQAKPAQFYVSMTQCSCSAVEQPRNRQENLAEKLQVCPQTGLRGLFPLSPLSLKPTLGCCQVLSRRIWR